jgi:salicylate hydroxylase
MNGSMDSSLSQTVAIAGGGIAGMAAGFAMARAGWQPVIHEQAPAFSEVGAGVQLGPNVTRILREWGLLEELMAVACQPTHLHARLADSGEVLASLDLHDLGQRYGAPYVSVHRADLHRVLQQAAVRQGAHIQAASTVVGLTTRSKGVDVQVAQMHEHVNADAITYAQTEQPIHALRPDLVTNQPCSWAVVADGVWSRLRQTLLNEGPPHWTGHVAYRALMPMTDLPLSMREGLSTHDITVWMGADMHLVCYPVSAGTRFNVVCLVEADLASEVADHPSWNQHKSEGETQRDLQRAMHGACSPLRQLVEACHGWRLWPLYARAPLLGPHQQAHERIALLGDAAHPMLPYLAQGAGMAIEDAAALARCVPLAQSDALATKLQQFANQRWQRNARVQRQAMRNGEIFHAQGWVRLGRDAGLRLLGARLMDNAWLYRG